MAPGTGAGYIEVKLLRITGDELSERCFGAYELTGVAGNEVVNGHAQTVPPDCSARTPES
jgi:hypothetical protein